MSRTSERSILLIAALLLVFPSLLAHADVSGERDPNDTRGPLDIKRIVHGHEDDNTVWHKVVMHKRWGAKDLAGTDEIRLFLSTDREDQYDEVHISIDVTDGELAARIFNYTEGSDYASVGPSYSIRFKRPTRYSVKVFFGEKWVRNRRDRYAWSAGSEFKDRDSRHCDEVCFDYAPGRNPDRLVHRL